MAQPSVAVKHVVAWQEEGRHAIVGSLRSAVTGPLALAASIDATPVIAWGSTAESLSDRDTYPTLGRTVQSDQLLAAGIVQSAKAIGWTRIAIVYVNDAWGRGLTQGMVSAANEAGVEVVASSDFALGDAQKIENAVTVIAETTARIVVCISYDEDLARVAEVADRVGMLIEGYAWILPALSDIGAIIATSSDPAKTQQYFTGWMVVALNPLHSGLDARYREVKESEPLEHLNVGILDGSVSESTVKGCDGYCAAIYDAIWTAAIAMSSMELAEDGSVDKAALLTAIRN
eukprot:1978335-Rhodomonas_salina.1